MADSNYKLKNSYGLQQVAQNKYNDIAKADKQIPVTAIPSITANTFATAVKVGKGNLCRIIAINAGFIAFGVSTLAAPTNASQDAIQLIADDQIYVIATDDYIRSNAIMRLEVIVD